MARRLLGLALIVAVLAPAPAAAQQAPPQPDDARLRAIVAELASPAYKGRRGEGAEKAADYLVNAFTELGLEPLFDGRFVQEVPGKEPGEVAGRNVGARLVGSDPALRDEWIILSAHYDHLGVRNGLLYPGADDNASGVAMLLESARCLAGGARPRRSLMFVAFDLEEVGLFGSRYFVEHPPVPLDQVGLFVTADLIGGSLGGVCKPYVFAIGTEYSPPLRDWIERATESVQGERPLKVGLLGTDMVGTRSDYGPFRLSRVPYLFFSTGEHPRYHTPEDRPETVDYPKLHAVSRLILGTVSQAASADALPRWTSPPRYAASEPAAVRDVLQTLLDHRDRLRIGTPQMLLMRNTVRNLDAIIARGTITPGERAAVVRVAQIILVSVL